VRWLALVLLALPLGCVEPVPVLCDAGKHPCTTGCCSFRTDHFEIFSAEPSRIRAAVDAAGRAHLLADIPDETLGLHYVTVDSGGDVERSELIDGDIAGGFDIAVDDENEPHILFNDAGERPELRLGRYVDDAFESVSLRQTSLETADIAVQDELLLIAFAQPEFVEGAAGVFLIRGDIEHELELPERIADLDARGAVSVHVGFDRLGRPVVSWSVDNGDSEHDVFVQRAFADPVLAGSRVAGVLRGDVAPDDRVALACEAPVEGVPSLVTLSAEDEPRGESLGGALGDVAFDPLGQLHVVRAGEGRVSYEIVSTLGERVRTDLEGASPGSVAIGVDGLGSPRVVYTRARGFSVTR
jgi:hypothetical protein